MSSFDINNNYKPRQPEFEVKPEYHSYKPVSGDALFGLIWEMYQFDNFSMTDSNGIGVIPDACADLMVSYSEGKMNMYIGGSASKFTRINLNEEKNVLFGVRFCTGSMGNLFKITAKEVAGCMVDATDALRNKEELMSKMIFANSFDERVGIATEYFVRQISEQYEVFPLVKFSVKYILDNLGNVNVSDLEELTGYSNRYVRKVFDEHVGVSPKLLSEIVKFQWSYNVYSTSKEKVNMAELAAMCGYYDQAHMNKVYKKFANSLPRNMLKFANV